MSSAHNPSFSEILIRNFFLHTFEIFSLRNSVKNFFFQNLPPLYNKEEKKKNREPSLKAKAKGGNTKYYYPLYSVDVVY